MKLFAPRNNWDMSSSESWWPNIGTQMTTSGKRVSEESAMTFSAVFAATRVISETLASLPCNVMERVDGRTNRIAKDHPVQRLVHDEPNPEQDSMCFTDMQTAFQVGWGNDYSEKQFDRAGNIVALWPIHPSRIPLQNITRNPQDPAYWHKIVAGEPGGIVYWVKNDDGSVTPIPASQMLHVPGVLSTNGITGQSIVRWAANSIGIAQSTEEHAGALFKNGALTNMVIKSPKIVSKETAERLRDQWQRKFAGPQNHYKTLLLEDGMEPVPINMNPQDTQLILARQFSVTEIARWYRLPPHMLGDLSRSTFSNIEAENLSFVVHSMLPWIVRREKAMNRQLLSADEKERYFFRYNVMGLLRGDSAARAQFYTAMFQMGAFSPNDILEREDMNPVPGGDQRFVPGNNLIPLDKASELAQANIDKAKAPPPAPNLPAESPKNDDSVTNALESIEILQRKLIQDVEFRDAEILSKIDKPSEVIYVSVPDTEAAEKIAIREAELAKEREKLAEIVENERKTTDLVLLAALKKTLEGLAAREAKAIFSAREQPREFVEWRAKFYSSFLRIFQHEISEFSEAFESCKLTLDVSWAADQYVKQSIDDLKMIDGEANDNHYDRVREMTDQLIRNLWTPRAENLAREIIERGRQ